MRALARILASTSFVVLVGLVNLPVLAETTAWAIGFEPVGSERAVLVGATYEVDVYDGMAAGRLILELENPAEQDLSARYLLGSAGAIKLGLLELETADSRGPLAAELKRPDEQAAARTPDLGKLMLDPAARAKLLAELERLRGRGVNSTASATPTGEEQRLRSEAFVLEAQSSAWIHTGFQLPLSSNGRLFSLRLPTLVGALETKPLPTRIVITVHREMPLLEVRSSTHEILVDFVRDRTIVETVQAQVPGDRSFELEFAVNSEREPTAAGYIRGSKNGRTAIEAVIAPPEVIELEEDVRPKELLFVVDSSGSMKAEEKLVQARRAVEQCVEKLRPVDRFNIIEFDTDFSMMSAKPVSSEQYDLERVARWLADVHPGGGTQLLPALKATLTQPEDRERHRMIVLVTDGILQDEADVLSLLEEELGEGRLFVVGTGQRIRQQTLLRLAEYGRGAVAFAGDAQQLQAAVSELFDSISQPIAWDVALELQAPGVELEEILPQRLPDLYAGRPVRVLAWVRGDVPAEMHLRMATMNGTELYQIKLPPRAPLAP